MQINTYTGIASLFSGTFPDNVKCLTVCNTDNIKYNVCHRHYSFSAYFLVDLASCLIKIKLHTVQK